LVRNMVGKNQNKGKHENAKRKKTQSAQPWPKTKERLTKRFFRLRQEGGQRCYEKKKKIPVPPRKKKRRAAAKSLKEKRGGKIRSEKGWGGGTAVV